MKVLIVGAGVIGTVYGAHLAADGHQVIVAAHGRRTETVARDGLRAHDLATGIEVTGPATVTDEPGMDAYDLIVVTVGYPDLPAAWANFAGAPGDPTVLIFGNNPHGRTRVPSGPPYRIWQGFPGVGGTLADGVAQYLPIRQQPTTLQAGADRAIDELAATLRRRGLPVTVVADMDGWLAHHATFVACVAAALQRCGTDPQRLAGDRTTLRLMCAAITEGFRAQHAVGHRGLPRNLGLLHHRTLMPVAMRYWAHTLRTPIGEVCFAAHTRTAAVEMRRLADDVFAQLAGQPRTESLHRLLDPSPPQ